MMGVGGFTKKAATLVAVLLLCGSTLGIDKNVGGDGDCKAMEARGVPTAQITQCHMDATQRSPSDPAVWLGLGLHFHMEGNTADARMAYLNVIKLSPESEHAAEAHLHDGVIHHSAGELDKALGSYENSVRIRPSSSKTLLNMAMILHTIGRHDDAIDTCKRAVESEPDHFGALMNLGIMQQQSGDLMGAIETYRKSIDLKPDFSGTYFNLGTALEGSGDLSQAIANYQSAIQLQEPPQNANPKFHSRLSLALVEAGHLERDMPQYFDSSRHCRPIGSRCRHEHTSLGTHERDLDPSFFANVGWVYMDTYLSFQPLELLLLWSSSMFEEALDRADGDYHAAQYGLGLARELMGRPEEALELYRRAKIQRPDSGTYVLAANRAQSAIGATGSSPADQRKVHFDVAYAKVDNSVEVTVDRFGCTSKFLSPLRVLERIARSTPTAMSQLAVHVNPFPALRTLPPANEQVSDLVSDIYIKGRFSGVILSNSAADLQPYRGVILAENVTMVLSDKTGSVAATQRMIHKYVDPKRKGNESLDFLRLDNVTCSCDVMRSILEGSEQDPPLVPKMVIMQINPAIPPPVRTNTCPRNGVRFEGAWGCSLAEATALMERHGYALVQLDFSDAMFVLASYVGVIQTLPPNAFTAHQLGYSLRPERLRCLGLYRGTLIHPEGDAWSRHRDPDRSSAEYTAYSRDPSTYIRGNPGRGDPSTQNRGVNVDGV